MQRPFEPDLAHASQEDPKAVSRAAIVVAVLGPALVGFGLCILLVGGMLLPWGRLLGSVSNGDGGGVFIAGLPADAMSGTQLFSQNCASCHGQDATGMPLQGTNLRVSGFVAHASDVQLLSFLKLGRNGDSPDTLTGRRMPARGGNPALRDGDLVNIVAYLRKVQPGMADEVAAGAYASPTIASLDSRRH